MPNDETMTLADVNSRLRRIKIRGGEYVTVAQRVQGFWEMYPDGHITTEFPVLTKEWCVCKATIYDTTDTVLATGTAYEEHTAGTGVNATSYIENCETSAVGRALGLAGIGSIESIASADEVAGAISQQEAKRKPAAKPAPAPQPQAAPVQAPQQPQAPAYDRNAMGALFAQAKARGIDIGAIVASLQSLIPGKESAQYTADDYATACNYIQSIIAIN